MRRASDARAYSNVDGILYAFFFQAEDGIRDRSPSRGLGDVYKRQEVQSVQQYWSALDSGPSGE